MNFICKYCTGTSPAYKINFTNNPRYKHVADPKWGVMIDLRCTTCGRHQKFVEQTEELRQELSGQTLIEMDYEKIKQERIGEIPAKLPFED